MFQLRELRSAIVQQGVPTAVSPRRENPPPPAAPPHSTEQLYRQLTRDLYPAASEAGTGRPEDEVRRRLDLLGEMATFDRRRLSIPDDPLASGIFTPFLAAETLPGYLEVCPDPVDLSSVAVAYIAARNGLHSDDLAAAIAMYASPSLRGGHIDNRDLPDDLISVFSFEDDLVDVALNCICYHGRWLYVTPADWSVEGPFFTSACRYLGALRTQMIRAVHTSGGQEAGGAEMSIKVRRWWLRPPPREGNLQRRGGVAMGQQPTPRTWNSSNWMATAHHAVVRELFARCQSDIAAQLSQSLANSLVSGQLREMAHAAEESFTLSLPAPDADDGCTSSSAIDHFSFSLASIQDRIESGVLSNVEELVRDLDIYLALLAAALRRDAIHHAPHFACANDAAHRILRFKLQLRAEGRKSLLAVSAMMLGSNTSTPDSVVPAVPGCAPIWSVVPLLEPAFVAQREAFLDILQPFFYDTTCELFWAPVLLPATLGYHDAIRAPMDLLTLKWKCIKACFWRRQVPLPTMVPPVEQRGALSTPSPARTPLRGAIKTEPDAATSHGAGAMRSVSEVLSAADGQFVADVEAIVDAALLFNGAESPVSLVAQGIRARLLIALQDKRRAFLASQSV